MLSNRQHRDCFCSITDNTEEQGYAEADMHGGVERKGHLSLKQHNIWLNSHAITKADTRGTAYK